MKKEIGNVIAMRRRERGLTKTELAHKADVSRASITKYEHGSRNPKLPAARRIAAALNIPVTDLLEERDREMMMGCDPDQNEREDRYARAGNYLRSQASEHCRTAVFAVLVLDGFSPQV